MKTWKIRYGDEGGEESTITFDEGIGYPAVREFVGKLIGGQLDFSEDRQTIIIHLGKMK